MWDVPHFTSVRDGFAAEPQAGYPRQGSVTMNDDRRRHPRFDVRGLSGVLDGFRAFEVLRLSAGGMLIRLPWEPSLGHRVRVELPLGSETFDAVARVVFIGPDLDPPSAGGVRFRVGLELVETGPADEAVLGRYIATELAAAGLQPASES